MYTTSESLLLKLKSSKDQQAWCRFVELYTPLLYHWARRLGLQSPDAADLAQDVLMLVFQKLPARIRQKQELPVLAAYGDIEQISPMLPEKVTGGHRRYSIRLEECCPTVIVG